MDGVTCRVFHVTLGTGRWGEQAWYHLTSSRKMVTVVVHQFNDRFTADQMFSWFVSDTLAGTLAAENSGRALHGTIGNRHLYWQWEDTDPKSTKGDSSHLGKPCQSRWGFGSLTPKLLRKNRHEVLKQWSSDSGCICGLLRLTDLFLRLFSFFSFYIQ